MAGAVCGTWAPAGEYLCSASSVPSAVPRVRHCQTLPLGRDVGGRGAEQLPQVRTRKGWSTGTAWYFPAS